MKLSHIASVDSFISGLLNNRNDTNLYSVKELGGNQSGLIEITLVKTYGEARSRIFATVIFDPVNHIVRE